MVLGALITLSATAAAQTKVEGFISQKSGSTLTLQMPDTTTVVVLMTDSTRVAQREGLVRKKDVSRAVLITGLQVTVEGAYDDQKQLVANSLLFSKDDLEKAQAIQAGVAATKARSQQNEAELERQNAELRAQNARLEAHAAKIAANKQAIEAANKRFGQLDEFNILDEVVIYFGNGRTALEPKYESQLLALCDKAKTIHGYKIQVKGYASAKGSVSTNQRLSKQRAEKVTNFVLQQGRIPLTSMLPAGAMGESRQVAYSDKPGANEAENRRVVVRILQNKGIAGEIAEE
jgi:outer membrane protein OmpA-like peptidoglycan-associated protein